MQILRYTPSTQPSKRQSIITYWHKKIKMENSKYGFLLNTYWFHFIVKSEGHSLSHCKSEVCVITVHSWPRCHIWQVLHVHPMVWGALSVRSESDGTLAFSVKSRLCLPDEFHDTNKHSHLPGALRKCSMKHSISFSASPGNINWNIHMMGLTRSLLELMYTDSSQSIFICGTYISQNGA